MRKFFSAFIIFVFFVSACKTPEAREPVKQFSGSFIKESVERNKKRYQEEEEIIRQIIQNDSTVTYIASKSGFWYKYIIKDTVNTIKPKDGDLVVFDYNINDVFGNSIYKKEVLSPKSYLINKEELISGLRDGLKLMKVGETITFLFPSHKAHGYYGDTDKIGVNIMLESTVTLKSIKQQIEN